MSYCFENRWLKHRKKEKAKEKWVFCGDKSDHWLYRKENKNQMVSFYHWIYAGVAWTSIILVSSFIHVHTSVCLFITITINLMRQFVSMKSRHKKYARRWLNIVVKMSVVLSLLRAHLASVCFEFSIDELWKFRFFKLNQAQLIRNDGCKLTAFDKTNTWINAAPVASIPFSQANCIQYYQVATLICMFGTSGRIMMVYEFS